MQSLLVLIVDRLTIDLRTWKPSDYGRRLSPSSAPRRLSESWSAISSCRRSLCPQETYKEQHPIPDGYTVVSLKSIQCLIFLPLKCMYHFPHYRGPVSAWHPSEFWETFLRPPPLVRTLASTMLVNTTSHFIKALLVYDISLTLSQEVNCIWNRQFGVVKVIYIVNRYGSLVNLVTSLVQDSLVPTSSNMC